MKRLAIIVILFSIILVSCNDIAGVDGQVIVIPHERDSTDILYIAAPLDQLRKGKNLWEICDLEDYNGLTLAFLNRSEKDVITIDSFQLTGNKSGFRVYLNPYVKQPPFDLVKDSLDIRINLFVDFDYPAEKKEIYRDTLLFLGTKYKMFFKKNH